MELTEWLHIIKWYWISLHNSLDNPIATCILEKLGTQYLLSPCDWMPTSSQYGDEDLQDSWIATGF